jgi:hypothetical protein
MGASFGERTLVNAGRIYPQHFRLRFMAEMRSAENRFLMIGETTSRAEDGEGLSRAAPVVGEGFILDVLVLEVVLEQVTAYQNPKVPRKRVIRRMASGWSGLRSWHTYSGVDKYVGTCIEAILFTGYAIMPVYLKWRAHAKPA